MARPDASPEPRGLLAEVLDTLEQPHDEPLLVRLELAGWHGREALSECLEEGLDALLHEPWRAGTLDLDPETDRAAVDGPGECTYHVARGHCG